MDTNTLDVPSTATVAPPATPDAPAAPPSTDPPALAAGAAPAAATPSPFGPIPEKYHVKAADGTPDVAASWLKVEQARAALETRLGSGDVAPKAPADYKITVPEKMGETFKADELAKDPMLQAFLKDAHAAGYSQKQVDVALAGWLERAPQIGIAQAEHKRDDAIKTVKESEGLKTDAEWESYVQKAYKAGETYGGKDFDGILKDYGNDPRIIRLLANVGKEIGEDKGPPAAAGQVADETIALIQGSKAYWDANDPGHAGAVAKVNAYYSTKYGNAPHNNGTATFSTR